MLCGLMESDEQQELTPTGFLPIALHHHYSTGVKRRPREDTSDSEDSDWVMLGELFSGSLRTSAVAVCTAVNWVTNWLVTRTFPLLVGTGLGVAYGLYTVFAFVALVFVWKVVPETSRKEIT